MAITLLQRAPSAGGSGTFDITVDSALGQFTTTSGAGTVPFDIPVGFPVELDTTNFANFDTSRVVADYDESRNRLTCLHDTGEAGEWANAANLPYARWRSKRWAGGHLNGHAFSTPGAHTLTSEIRDLSGESGTASMTFNVVDYDTFFATAKRFIVATDGNFSGAPGHNGANEFTTIDAALTAAKAESGRVVIYLKSGQTFTGGSNLRFDTGWTGTMVFLAAWGAGAKPIINADGSSTYGIQTTQSYTGDGVFLKGITLGGTWDPVNLGPKLSTRGIFQYRGNIGFTDCELSGFEIGLYPISATDTDPATKLFLVDTYVRDWSQYAILDGTSTSDSQVHMVGSNISMDPQSAQGVTLPSGASQYRPYVNSQNVRINSARVSARGCDGFGRQGWSANDAGEIGIQAWRFFPRCQAGHIANVWGCMLESGFQGIASKPSGPEYDPSPMTMTFDSILMIRDAFGQGPGFEMENTGFHARNIMLVRVGVPKLYSSSANNIVEVTENAPVTAGWADAECAVYSSTAYDDRTDAQGSGQQIVPAVFAAALTNTYEGNNVVRAPNISTPQGDSNIDETALGVTPRNLGKRYGIRDTTTTIGSIAPGGSFTASYPSGFGQADFTGANVPNVMAVVIAGQVYFEQESDQLNCTFNAGDVTFENPAGSGVTWPAGTARMVFDVAKTDPMDATYATPAASIINGSLLAGHPGITGGNQGASELWALLDHTGQWRDDIRPSGRATNAQGAFESDLVS